MANYDIFQACEKGDVALVKTILRRPFINMKDEHEDTALGIAVQNNHLEVVKVLSTYENLKIEESDGLGYTALHDAAYKSERLEILKFLIEKGMDVNIRNRNEETPFYIAARQNNIEAVKYLLTLENVDITLTDDICISPLYIASMYGHIEIVKIILEHVSHYDKYNGVDIFTKSKFEKYAYEVAKTEEIKNLILSYQEPPEIKGAL